MRGAGSTHGLLVPGEEREGQVLRREEVARQFGLTDHADPVVPDYSPWDRDGFVLPWEELYYAPFENLYARAAGAGHKVFCTGLGGNDLLAQYWEEMPDKGLGERSAVGGEGPLPDLLAARVRDAHRERTARLNDLPRAFVQRSVMDFAAGMAAQTLRFGLWPVHPLITPEVVRYAHALPSAWRSNRRLMSELLARWGVSRSVTHP